MNDQSSFWRDRQGLTRTEAEKEVRVAHLRRGFGGITRAYERALARRRAQGARASAASGPALEGLALWGPAFCGAALGVGLFFILTDPARWIVAAQRIAAFPNCAAARAVHAAPARRGDPGYWRHLDRDRDGIACEPWPR